MYPLRTLNVPQFGNHWAKMRLKKPRNLNFFTFFTNKDLFFLFGISKNVFLSLMPRPKTKIGFHLWKK